MLPKQVVLPYVPSNGTVFGASLSHVKNTYTRVATHWFPPPQLDKASTVNAVAQNLRPSGESVFAMDVNMSNSFCDISLLFES